MNLLRFKKLSVLLLLVFILLSVVQLSGQEPVPSPAQEFENTTLEPRNFKESDWEKASQGIDYRHSTKEDKDKKDKDKDSADGRKSRMQEKADDLGGAAGAFWNVLVKIIFVFFAAVIVGLLIYYIMRGENIFKRKEKTARTTDFTLEEVETNLATSDLDRFILQAEKDGDYPLAIRLHYLAIIKALSLKKIIRYKKNKTNHVYVSRVNATPFGAEFQRATIAFERIWFGQNTFTQSDYQVMKPDFQKWIVTAQSLSNEKSSLKTNTA